MYLSQKQRFCVISILGLLDLALCRKIVLERSELVYINPETFEMSSSVKRMKRTTVAMNMSIHVFQDIPSDARFHIGLCGFYSNAYRKLALNIERNLCSMFDFEYKFIKNELKGHVPDKCPVIKGCYYIRNYLPNTRNFPPSPWATSKYYVQLTMVCQEIMQVQYRVYVRVERNPLEFR